MAYAVVPAPSTVRRVLRELADTDRKAVIDSLQGELRGVPALTTARVYSWTLPRGVDYWLTVLSCGWQATYRRLTEKELREFSGRYGRPSPYLGFYVADLQPIDPIGPSTGVAGRSA